MRKIVYTSNFIKGTILALVLIAIISIWPMNIWSRKILVSNEPTGAMSEVINYRNTASQAFIPTEDRIANLTVYVGEKTRAKEFTATLFSSQNKLIATQKVQVPDVLPAKTTILMDVEVTPNEIYNLKIDSLESLYLGQEPWTNPAVVAASSYNETVLQGMNLTMDYEYEVKCNTRDKLLAIGIILAIGAILLYLVHTVFKNRDDKMTTLEGGLKWILNPLVAFIVVISLIAIFTGRVNRYLPDNIFATVAVIIFGVICFWAINHEKTGQDTVVTREYIYSLKGDLLQSVAIAGVLQACCKYVSGLYDIHHAVAERREMLWFAVAIIAMFGLREVVNWYNVIYIVIAAIGGVFYYRANVTEEMSADDLWVLKATIAIAILLGLILIRTIKVLVHQGKQNVAGKGTVVIPFAGPNWIVLIATVAFLTLTIIYRNGRWWTVALAVTLVLFGINYAVWDRREHLISNIMRGVCIQFIFCTIWVWLYRPYTTYRSARFTHFFHTETITATYLTMVGCVAVILVLAKVRKLCIGTDENGKNVVLGSFKIRDIWKEMMFFGSVMVYLIFTMARTAYAAIVVSILLAMLVMIFGKGKGFLKVAGQTVLWMLISVVLLLPVIFEIQRTVPCLVDRVYEYDIDAFQEETKRGRQLDAPEYMMVGALADIFCEKILGIENAGFDAYYNTPTIFDEYGSTVRELVQNKGVWAFKHVNISDDMWDQKYTKEIYDVYVSTREEIEEAQAAAEEAAQNGETATTDEGATDGAAETAETTEASETLDTGNGNTVITETEAVVSENDKEIEYVSDYTNGRLDIYKSYIEQMNMTGHEGMGAVLKDGSISSHAHDVYLQVAFDHGIPTGIVFVIFLGICYVAAFIFYFRNKINWPNSALTFTLLTAFGVAGLVEWTYHLGHPMTIAMWLSVIPLIFMKRDRNIFTERSN